MLEYQERVVKERVELDDKIVKLTNFFKTPLYEKLDFAEMDRLSRQLEYMVAYSEVLSERILNFK